MTFPRYDELPVNDRGHRFAWGEPDEAGTLNFIDDDAITRAAREVRAGAVALSAEATAFTPPLHSTRPAPRHVASWTPNGRDDRLDGSYLQSSSHWDGLAHIRAPGGGFYGGRDEAAVEAGELGIDRMAPRGIVGRGVLADIPRLHRHMGAEWDPAVRNAIGPELIAAALDAGGVSVVPGDILLVRTGWVGHYLGLSEQERNALTATMGLGTLESAGLVQGDAMPRWLWDHQIAAVASDKPALEALPVKGYGGFLHRYLIPLLGMPIGELWALDELADICDRLGRWSFFLASVPLKLAGGVGAPNNAVAIFYVATGRPLSHRMLHGPLEWLSTLQRPPVALEVARGSLTRSLGAARPTMLLQGSAIAR